ncbi:MAG: CvpA family protein [Prevotellaceae bacterium]|jgi:membrane protein required for colicin V production|nr:CvpA family protein [Prevotellaceae bacterium]
MTALDYVIIGIVVIGAIRGCLKGFLRELATVIGLIVGFVVARTLYLSLAEKLAPALEDSMTFAQVISFIAIWVLVPLLCMLLASLITHALEAIGLGFINRLLGIILGATTWIIILGALANVLDYLDTGNVLLSETTKQESYLYVPLKTLFESWFPVAKELTDSIWNN